MERTTKRMSAASTGLIKEIEPVTKDTRLSRNTTIVVFESTHTDVIFVSNFGTNTRQLKKPKAADSPTTSIVEADNSLTATMTDATST